MARLKWEEMCKLFPLLELPHSPGLDGSKGWDLRFELYGLLFSIADKLRDFERVDDLLFGMDDKYRLQPAVKGTIYAIENLCDMEQDLWKADMLTRWIPKDPLGKRASFAICLARHGIAGSVKAAEDVRGQGEEHSALVIAICRKAVQRAFDDGYKALMTAAAKIMSTRIMSSHAELDPPAPGTVPDGQVPTVDASDSGVKPLPDNTKRAYRSCLAAESALGNATDKKYYAWVKENSPFDAYTIEYATWVRYVRIGRKHYGTSKNSPRNSRDGRSIVRQDEIENADRQCTDENG